MASVSLHFTAELITILLRSSYRASNVWALTLRVSHVPTLTTKVIYPMAQLALKAQAQEVALDQISYHTMGA